MIFDNIGNGVYFVDAAKGLTLHAAKEQFIFNVSGDVVHFIHPINKEVGKYHINDIKKSNGTVHGTNITDVMDSLHQVNNKNFSGGGGSYDRVGEIIAWSSPTPPPYALACDGGWYLKADYPDLYAKIGNRYTAIPSDTHFNVPTTEGLLLKGAGGSVTVGQIDGSDVLEIDHLPAHTHQLYGNSYFPSQNSIAGGFLSAMGQGGEGNISNSLVFKEAFGEESIGNTGAGQPHTHPYLGVLYCIIYQ